MDEYFAHFLKEFGPPVEKRVAPQASISRYHGKLPDQLIAYWLEHGWCGYGEGLFWIVNPQEYDPVVQAWIGDTPYWEQDKYHVIARSAFGDIYLFGEHHGRGLHIIGTDRRVMLTERAPADLNHGVRTFIGSRSRDAVNLLDANGTSLFAPALKKLGPLKRDEMYGFVPGLVLGGPATLEHVHKVKAVEHLVRLAPFSELEVSNS